MTEDIRELQACLSRLAVGHMFGKHVTLGSGLQPHMSCEASSYMLDEDHNCALFQHTLQPRSSAVDRALKDISPITGWHSFLPVSMSIRTICRTRALHPAPQNQNPHLACLNTSPISRKPKPLSLQL